jgi:signal transduction histidine kinase
MFSTKYPFLWLVCFFDGRADFRKRSTHILQASPQQPSKPPISEIHVLKMLSSGAPIDDILNELCNFLDVKSPGVIPTVLLPHRDGMHLRLAAGPKVPKIWNEAFDGLKVSSYASFQADGPPETPIPVADMKSDPSFAACWDVVSCQGVQAAWSVPIVSGTNKLLGAMILFYPTAYRPTQRDLALIEQVIHMAAIAIECHRSEEELREFSRRLYQSQDDERRRIARELHDSTGQKLAVLGIKLSEVESSIPAAASEPHGTLSECTSLTRSIADEIRTLSYLLHPPLLDECGLYSAIHWYVDGINQRHGLCVDVEIPQNLRRLSEDAELAIFRIVQASLTNVHLHSKARTATVRIGQAFDGVTVEVRDDGRGIPDGVLNHSARTRSVGVGITGMRERAEELGGHLEIETGGNGTKVKATIPSRNFRIAARL